MATNILDQGAAYNNALSQLQQPSTTAQQVAAQPMANAPQSQQAAQQPPVPQKPSILDQGKAYNDALTQQTLQSHLAPGVQMTPQGTTQTSSSQQQQAPVDQGQAPDQMSAEAQQQANSPVIYSSKLNPSTIAPQQPLGAEGAQKYMLSGQAGHNFGNVMGASDLNQLLQKATPDQVTNATQFSQGSSPSLGGEYMNQIVNNEQPLQGKGEIAGYGQGLKNKIAGIGQLGVGLGTLSGLLSPEDYLQYNHNVQNMLADQKTNNPDGQAGRDIATYAGPENALAASGAASTVGRALQNSLLFGTLSSEQIADSDNPVDKLKQFGVGAGIGAGASAIASGVGALAGGYFRRSLPEAQALLTSAQEQGLNPTVGQVMGRPGLRDIEKSIEGLTPSNDLRTNTNWFINKAKDLIGTDTPPSTEDVSQAIQNHINNNISTIKSNEQNLWNDATTAINGTGQNIPVTNMIQTLNKREAQLSNSLTRTSGSDPALQYINGIKSNLSANNGLMIKTQVPADVLNATRQDITNDSFMHSDPTVRSIAHDLNGSIMQDFKDFGNSTGSDVGNKLQTAINYTRDTAKPYESNQAIKKFMGQNTSPDTAFQYFTNPNNPSRIQALAPDDALKQQMQQRTLSDAYQSAKNPNTGVWNQARFMSEVAKSDPIAGDLFTPAQQTKLQGFANLRETLEPQRIEGDSAALKTQGFIDRVVDMGKGATEPLWKPAARSLGWALANPKTSQMLIDAASMQPGSVAARRATSMMLMQAIHHINNNPDDFSPNSPNSLYRQPANLMDQGAQQVMKVKNTISNSNEGDQ